LEVTRNQTGAGESDRAVVLGCAIDRLDMPETVARCREIIEQGSFAQQVSINAAKVVAMQEDAELRASIEGCALVSPDGQSIVWASRLLGDPLPERVAGIDLMHNLIALAECEGYGIYILGARQEVLEAAVSRLRSRFPNLRICGYRDGYFSDEESPKVADAIRASGAQVLFVAISSPKKETWLAEYGHGLGVPFVMGVGGSVDILAGITRRAPAIWQRFGLEWLYRLLQEPRRMLHRYLVSNVRFAVLVVGALAGRLYGRR
jgi:N-acetylglucosaminyldiphosphoundecaprenol N-acetyl-beta-D-mannosaminyltransferase